ncbi:hypothetical protein [Clostridium sp. AUH-JLR23]|uniref:hypothetical protein n=1 Tax=Clostridium sp. AUH-JLR23 TaxID=1505062 RepID=UPI003568675D
MEARVILQANKQVSITVPIFLLSIEHHHILRRILPFFIKGWDTPFHILLDEKIKERVRKDEKEIFKRIFLLVYGVCFNTSHSVCGRKHTRHMGWVSGYFMV